MSVVLISLRNYCDQLESDKVTERKKNVDLLKKELNRASVQQKLDVNTKRRDGFTWNAVFRSICSYMLKESEYLKKNKGVSSTSVSTRDRRKQEVGTIFKWFVRKANQRGELLACSKVVQHILTLMKDDFTASAFGVDCCSVLLKDVLRSRKYYCELTHRDWQELLDQSCRALREPIPGLSSDLMSQVVRSVVSGAVVQSNISTAMFRFFGHLVGELRSEKSATVVENVLSMLNVFCRSVAADCRSQLCKFGESHMAILMHVWNNHWKAASVKEEMVKFFCFQMSVHHPNGVVKESDGACASDFPMWKKCVRELYTLIYEDWTVAGTRIKLKTAWSRDAAYVDLAADVCHQVFSDGDPSFQVCHANADSSQIGTGSHHQSGGGGGGGAKRRRVESGWDLLRDTLTSIGCGSGLILWLQLLRALLHKYPRSLPDVKLLPFLLTLQQLQTDCKRGEVQPWLLQTLQSLTVCQSDHRQLSSSLRMALDTEWTKVWSCALRTVRMHTIGESEGFDLLTSLLHHGNMNPDKEIWMLFRPDACPPTRSSLRFLVTYLSHHSLPENYRCKANGEGVSGSAVAKRMYPLRHQLLNWLLPSEENEEPTERVQLVKNLKSLPLSLVADILARLTQRTIHVSLSDDPLHDDTTPGHWTAIANRTDHVLHDVTSLYLRSSFSVPAAEPSTDVATDQTSPAGASSSVVMGVKLSLMQRLENVGTQVLDYCSSEVGCVDALIHYASLLCKTLAVLHHLGVISDEEMHSSKLNDSLKTLLKRVSDAMLKLWNKNDTSSNPKTRIQTLSSLILALDEMLTWRQHGLGQEGGGSAGWLAGMCRSVTPPGLLKLLFDIVKKRGKNVSSRKMAASQHVAKDPFGDDVMDTDFDEVPTEATDDFDMNSNLNEENLSQKGRQDLLSPSALTDVEVLAVRAVHMLCTWCFTGGEDLQTDDLSQLSTERRLLDLVDKDGCDPSTTVDVQLFFTIAESFIGLCSKPDDTNVKELLYALRTVATAHHKDQELTASCLGLLSMLILFLGSSSRLVSDELKQARDVTLHLVAAFWKLQCKEALYTPPVRLAIARCMHALIRIDPAGQWTVLRPKVGNQDDVDQPVRGEFCLLLKDKSHAVRMYMAVAVKCLFCSDGVAGVPFTTEVQNQSFDTLYQTIQEAMNMEEQTSSGNKTAEFSNRITGLLSTLCTVARCSAVCEKKTVFALMQAVRLNSIDLRLIKKVLQNISRSLDYTTIRAFMESHLGYLIHQWLDEQYHLSQFPYQLLACETDAEFYRQYQRVLIPHLVTLQDLDMVRRIAETLNEDWLDLLKATFPQAIAHILPMFGHTRAEEDAIENDEYQKRRAHAMLCLKSLEEPLGKETIDSLIQSHLVEIVIELLSMLYEPHSDNGDLAQYTSDTDPAPNPPFISAYTIKATLDYLTKCHSVNKALTLVSLLAKTQDSIQKILLALHVRIAKSHCSHEKRRTLLAYRLFASLLLTELPDGLGGSWAMVLQDVVYTLVHTIQEGRVMGGQEGRRLGQPCVNLLHSVCDTALIHCHEEMGKHLHVIIHALVPLIEAEDQLADQALALINLLTIDNAEELASALKYLDPFPDSPKLARARKAQMSARHTVGESTLMEEVNLFLMAGDEQGGILRLEGLRHLHRHLTTKKEELALMVQQCTDGCDKTIIELITELLDLSGSSQRTSDNTLTPLKEEAGDIGAANLSTVALHCDIDKTVTSYSTALRVLGNDPILSRHVVVIHLLKDYLVDPNVDTVEAAANCLKTVLATPSGQRCYEAYKDKKIDKLFCYLHPFKPSKKKVHSRPQSHTTNAPFSQTIGDPLLWQPLASNHSDWVRNLTVALIASGGVRDEILLLLRPICKVKVEFAEKVLPYLVHDILSSGVDTYRLVLSERVQAALEGYCQSASGSRATTPVSFMDAPSNKLGQRSIRTLLDVMLYLRKQERPTGNRSKSTAWDNNFWLDVNYLVIAKAAQNCRAHFTCLLYTEIWCEVERSRQGTTTTSSAATTCPQSLRRPPDLATLSSLSNSVNINVQSLLLEAYSSIGEPDGVYGCGAGRLTDTHARIQTYEHEGDWMKALGAYDLKLHSKSGQTDQQEMGVLQSLQNQGLDHIVTVYLQGLRSEDVAFTPEMAEYQYEAAWRSGIWDLDLNQGNHTNSFPGYHRSLHTALSCLHDEETDSFRAALQQARLDTVRRLCHASIESAYSVYPMLARLQGLVEMEDCAGVMFRNQPPTAVLQKWTAQLPLMDNDFEFAETNLALRTILLQILLEKSNDDDKTCIYEGLVAHLQNQTKMARKAQRFQIAERSLATLTNLCKPHDVEDDQLQWSILEEAKIYWDRGEKTTAMYLIRAQLDRISKTDQSLHPQLLTMYGHWLAATCSESPNVIIEQYMEQAADIYNGRDDTTLPAIESYLTLGHYADTQYQNVVNYMKSSEHEAKQALCRQAKNECSALMAMGDNNTRYHRLQKKQSEIDESECQSMMQDRENYLHKAMECYIKCLQHGSQQHDMRVFRICSLWFDNSGDDCVNGIIQEALDGIESRKFLPLLYQLAARMTTKTQDKQPFYSVLNKLIETTAKDHPHHALPIILALANANKDAVITAKRSSGKLSRSSAVRDGDTDHADEVRMQAAKYMLDRLRSTRCAPIINQLQKLSDAYIELAYWDVSDRKKETGAIKLPSSQPLTKLPPLQHVAMPTAELPVDPCCGYTDIVTVQAFDDYVKLAGGINLPKILTCIGSDGVRRRQLVKGKDDLRQDAVMQQVFLLVNKLLQRNQDTRKRRLQIRTYKIVPLSQRSGLLEWCEGTVPIGQYLIGNQRTDLGAHKRYRPKDLTSMDCRRKMQSAHSSTEPSKKYKEYLDVMKTFQPVFRHFFLEKFPDPNIWLERRLAYTRSVATSSIVGYVVGLGDRHVQNILIDCNTAELVHIDLGVAFEQGRILPTPETVPFRLTRDLEDGMGIAGVEGVFRRCCEKTMDVMHNSQEALLTIIQVLLYDPLYLWTMSPQKAMELQQRRDPDISQLNTSADLTDGGFRGHDGGEGTEVNKVAERVVLRLKQKLQGVEEGVAMSVEGQVNRLIQEARDPKNLCRLFPGWQPWI